MRWVERYSRVDVGLRTKEDLSYWIVQQTRSNDRRPSKISKDPMQATAHRVLVVDDNVDSTEPLTLLLQAKGHETRVATAGDQAITLADEFRPNVVVLDLGLPRMDGYEVARRLRDRPYGGGLVLVALTGWTGRDVRSKAAAAGFDYHLVKPVNWEELEKIVGATKKRAAR